jgi:hypothetical protein
MTRRLLVVPFILWCSVAGAQSHTDSIPAFRHRKVIGMNLSPLAAKFIPFKEADDQLAGPFQMRFKAYGPKNAYAFRFSMGIRILPDENGEPVDPQLNLAIGWERRRSLTQKWIYTRGMDFMLLAGDLNVPGNIGNEENAMVGFGPVWGIEYLMDRRLSIGVESTLFLGYSISQDVVVFNIIPPVGIFLNHYF